MRGAIGKAVLICALGSACAVDSQRAQPIDPTDETAGAAASGPAAADPIDVVLNEDEAPDYSDQAIADYVAGGSGNDSVVLSAAPPGAPNIVVIIADDMPRGLMGFEGNRVIQTPNLDRLRREGVYFSRFYLPIGQCAPSRTILWTGLFPTQSGVETNGDLFKDARTMVLPLWLRQHGYQTGFFGKCHIGTKNPGSLDVDWHFDSIFHTEGVSPAGKWDLYDYRVYLRKNVSPPSGGAHYTKEITDKTIEFIRASGAKPFFVWVAHRAPHWMTIASTGPNGQWDNAPPGAPRYRVDQMPHALNAAKGADTLATKPPQHRNSPSRIAHRRISAELEHLGGFREHTRRAHEQVDYLDRQVGRLLRALDDAGKRENTLVVFLSDNGVFFGERGFCGKGPFNYDEITRVPLLLSWPGVLPANATRRALIQSTDLASTVLAAAGLPKIPGSKSSSFWKVARGEKTTHRRAILFQYYVQKIKSGAISPIRGVLKDNFKFSHYLWSRYFAESDALYPSEVPLVVHSGSTFELYDLGSDPDELNNLLPYRDKQTSALWAAWQDGARRARLNDLLRTLAEYQTVARDSRGVELVDFDVRRTGASTAVLRWRSVRPQGGQPVNASAEVVYRKSGCTSCQVFEVDHKEVTADHHVTLTGLAANTAYEALVFSITPNANGGKARYLIPAAAGDPGRPADGGWPRLTYVWGSYSPRVIDYAAPPPVTRGQCRITSASGHVFADYQTEYKICTDDCRTRQLTNPRRSCSWNGAVFHRPP